MPGKQPPRNAGRVHPAGQAAAPNEQHPVRLATGTLTRFEGMILKLFQALKTQK
jgi:hypothetical protein